MPSTLLKDTKVFERIETNITVRYCVKIITNQRRRIESEDVMAVSTNETTEIDNTNSTRNVYVIFIKHNEMSNIARIITIARSINSKNSTHV